MSTPISGASTAPAFKELQEAADWFAVLQDKATDEAERMRWKTWLNTGPGQRAAWERVEAVAGELAGLAGLPVRQILDRTAAVSGRRRTALRALAIVPVASLSGWQTLRSTPWRSWVTAYRTNTGERREVVLTDGSRLWLNTATIVDIDFTQRLRRIVLYKGEILVTSGHGDHVAAPLVVDVLQGRLTALGTQFAVRHEGEGFARLAVFEGAVEAQPIYGGEPRTLAAGEQTRVFASRVETPSPVTGADSYKVDWTRGMLVTNGMRLGDFVAELGRYRPGYMACAPEVADLRIVGAFPLSDPDRILDALQSTLPVKVHRPLPWWTMVSGKPPTR